MARIDAQTINKRLEKALLQIRKEADLTQVDVAKRLKKPQSFVSKYETGERKLTVGDFIVVCRVLGVDPEENYERVHDKWIGF